MQDGFAQDRSDSWLEHRDSTELRRPGTSRPFRAPPTPVHRLMAPF